MTANDIVSTTMVLMCEDADAKSDWSSAFISVLNLLLSELFDVNNSILAAAGEDELTEIPTVSALTDTVAYNDGLCRRVLPYGAAGMLLAEDNPALCSQYKNKYEYEKANAYRAVYSDIDDLTQEEE